MNKTLLLLAGGLALAALLPAPAAAQFGSRAEEQAFDYDPGAEAAEKVQRSSTEVTFEDAEMINHPIYGTIVLSKYRWRSWVTRALYLTLINIALLAIILAMPRNQEANIILGYTLCGVSMSISFWTFLCAVLIFMLKAAAWTYVLPVALGLGAAGYLILMRIKKSDVSLSELKESFQKMNKASTEDPRLTSVPGTPGDWPGDDFLR
ncbi:MAG: hypothetical protein CVU79_04495 [Elusimicrobia bacterium HGW-Elusimicrobia-3]|nr:MAG: hypothetical protein CVU79_04495 [Elusimicrobia bacterium HGW-Elusimicrobia-3]